MRFKKVYSTLLAVIAALVAAPCAVGGPGRFDSIGGTYPGQTGFAFDKRLYYEALTRTVVGSLVRSSQTAQMLAGGDPLALDTTAGIWSKPITSGDEVRFTLVQRLTGTPTRGDKDVMPGDMIEFQAQKVRVNQLDSPAYPVQGRNSQYRVKDSIGDLPAAVKQAVMNWCAEQDEIDFIKGLIYGGDPGVLGSASSGGLADTLGFAANNTAGYPLMPMNMIVGVAAGGWLGGSYSATGTTWNGFVNDAIYGITANSSDYVTLAALDKTRAKLDDLKFNPISVNGRSFKSIKLCDPDIWYRINHLLSTYFQSSSPREKGEFTNPIFGVDHVLEYDGSLYLNVPSLKKFRAVYHSVSDTVTAPDLGVVCTQANMEAADPRTAAVTGNNAWIIDIGGGAMLRGTRESIWTTTNDDTRHGKRLEYSGHMDLGYKRGEWFANDGRVTTSDCLCYGVLASVYYEPGVGTGY